jgi:hypothetical protein
MFTESLTARPELENCLETGPAVLDAAGEIYGDVTSLEGQGRRIVKKSILAAAMSAFVSTAQAQGYVLQPSQVPAYVTPGSNGTAVLQTPGRGPTYLIPHGDGSYVIPGQRPTYVTPRGNGTYAIQSPGRAPLTLRRQRRGRALPQGAARDCAVRKTECLSSELTLAHMRQ